MQGVEPCESVLPVWLTLYSTFRSANLPLTFPVFRVNTSISSASRASNSMSSRVSSDFFILLFTPISASGVDPAEALDYNSPIVIGVPVGLRCLPLLVMSHYTLRSRACVNSSILSAVCQV